MTEIRSMVRAGRFVRVEREATEWGIQVWALAGELGAAELRSPGVRRSAYCMVHSPVALPGFVSGHRSRGRTGARVRGCDILEGECWAAWDSFPAEHMDDDEPWAGLEKLYAYWLEGL